MKTDKPTTLHIIMRFCDDNTKPFESMHDIALSKNNFLKQTENQKQRQTFRKLQKTLKALTSFENAISPTVRSPRTTQASKNHECKRIVSKNRDDAPKTNGY